MLKKLCSLLMVLLLLSGCALCEGQSIEEVEEDVILTVDGEEILLASTVQNGAREDLIDRIIAKGKELYDKANGRPQRAADGSDIYVCKNFTTYLFRNIRQRRMQDEYGADVGLTCTFECFGGTYSGNDRAIFQLRTKNVFCVFHGGNHNFRSKKVPFCGDQSTSDFHCS